MLDGTGRFGQQAKHLARSTAVVQQAALLGFPQNRDRVNGLAAAGQGGQALPQAGVQRQGEVLGEQPPDGLDIGGVGRGGGEQNLFLLDCLCGVGCGGRRRGGGARQHTCAWREAVSDVIHDRSECVRLGEHRLYGVREAGVVDGVDEAFCSRP